MFYYDVKGSVKKVKIKQNERQKKRTQKATKHTNFPVFSSTEDVPVHTSVSLLFHVHKQKYIHSSHFGTVFFLFFCTQKLQKAPKSTIESACGDPGCAASSLTQRWSPPQNSYLIYLF